MPDEHVPSGHTGSVQGKTEPPTGDTKPVSSSELTWMTILSFVVFALGVAIAVLGGGI